MSRALNTYPNVSRRKSWPYKTVHWQALEWLGESASFLGPGEDASADGSGPGGSFGENLFDVIQVRAQLGAPRARGSEVLPVALE